MELDRASMVCDTEPSVSRALDDKILQFALPLELNVTDLVGAEYVQVLARR